ncbi:MAG: hypothetical protein AB1631_03240 [Acidobacteriota bacterium]
MATEITGKAKQAGSTKASTKRTKTATRKSTKKRKELTAKEATLRAWQMTYENRHKRLD